MCAWNSFSYSLITWLYTILCFIIAEFCKTFHMREEENFIVRESLIVKILCEFCENFTFLVSRLFNKFPAWRLNSLLGFNSMRYTRECVKCGMNTKWEVKSWNVEKFMENTEKSTCCKCNREKRSKNLLNIQKTHTKDTNRRLIAKKFNLFRF